RFYPLDPRPEDIRLEDVAQGLAHTCRYTGQCDFFYSVALHSIHVSTELSRLGHGENVQLYGLLHDAPEAYLSDIARPVKENLPDYREMENRIQKTVWEAFEIGEPSHDEWKAVKRADERLLNYEAETLLSATWTQNHGDMDYELKKPIE
ncbi:MAG: hypothetical protein SV377_06455, partial [Halobacteria archaeon]|nr:hypothetical protein [Halobacteria archaeon]